MTHSPQRPGRTDRSSRRVRAATYLVVGAAAAGAVYLTPSLPGTPAPAGLAPAASLADSIHAATAAIAAAVPAPALPVWRQRADTLGRGETLVEVLERAGVDRVAASRLLKAAGTVDARRLRAGLVVTSRGLSTDSVPQEVSFQPAVDRVVHLRFLAGAWKAVEERLAWRTDTVAARVAITSSLYDALHRGLREQLPAATRSELTWKLADIFEYRLDMSSDLQRGDSVRLLLERTVAPDGSPRDAKILAASLSVSGKQLDAIRFKRRGDGSDFFDGQGKSLRAAFLRAPLEFRRISSGFGLRVHPILGILKAHKGTDYAASSGTPVRAIGEGVVVKAGWAGGYGNVLEIRHPNGFVSRYGHLRGFAKGVRPGRTVGIGQTVAYVGTTGLSTAPHLHFEVLVDGRQRDPRVALRDKSGFPIPSREKGAFAALRSRFLSAMNAPARATDPRARVALAE